MTIVDCTLLAEVDMISAGVVGLIALIVFVFAILSAKSWHWINVVFLIFTLIASITAIVGMTKAFDHRYEGMKAYQAAVKEADKREKEVAEIVGGDPLSVKYGENSLRYNNNQLALAMTGRGRAWRAGAIEAAGDNRKFTLQSQRNLEEEASLVGAIMYAFADTGNIPNRYIGSVLISAETNADFTLQPVDVVDTERFDDFQTTWTLYEKMPQDRHGIFKRALEAVVDAREGAADTAVAQQQKAFVERLRDETQEFDIATFVEILKRDFLPADQLGYDADSLEYEQMIDQYAFDRQSVSKIAAYISDAPGRKDTEKFDPPPRNVAVKFSFTEASDIAVSTDADEGALEDSGLFNEVGESVIGKLRQNPDGVTFRKNDVIEIDELSSGEFARTHDGKIKEIDRIYVRELQDFPLMFKDRKIRITKLEELIITAKATAEKTQVALKDAQEQIEVRTDLLTKITEDEEGLTQDDQNLRKTNEALKQQSVELAEQIKNREAKIESLYEKIKNQALESLRNAVSVSN